MNLNDLKQHTLQDYGYAILELAYKYDKTKKQCSLAFGFIEFASKERFKDLEFITNDPKKGICKGSDNFYIRDIFNNDTHGFSYKKIDDNAPLIKINSLQEPSRDIIFPIEIKEAYPFISDSLNNFGLNPIKVRNFP